jgi:DNA (cytosine-5)-methyltransferase 1
MDSYTVQKLGVHRAGLPRFYKQGRRLALAGFAPGKRFTCESIIDRGMLILRITDDGNRTVSRKVCNDEEVPVVDITSRDVLAVFAGMDQIRVIVRPGHIYLMALATEVRRQERLGRLLSRLASRQPLDVGSLSHGTGLLSDALKTGMSDVGVNSTLMLANDIDSRYLEHSQTVPGQWNDDTVELAAPLQVVAFDEWATSRLPKLDVLSAGLPCTAASLAGRAKKGLAHSEQDPNVGHLVVAFLQIILRTSPSVVILENVPQWETSASMSILRTTLTDWSYVVHTRVLAASDFGSLENRKRLCVVAVTKGMEFDFDALPEPVAPDHCVADILDPVPDDDPSWSTMAYLRDKEERDLAAGKNFRMQLVDPKDTSVPTIGRGYHKRRSTEPFLRHPNKADLLRLFTPAEHSRIKNASTDYVKGLPDSVAHQVLGQGICCAPFVAVGRMIGRTLLSFARLEHIEASPAT